MCNFYMMYYSDNSKNIPSYIECVDDRVPRVSQHIPVDSAKPLPPNPLLEAKASIMNMQHPHSVSTIAKSSTSNGNPSKEMQKQGK